MFWEVQTELCGFCGLGFSLFVLGSDRRSSLARTPGKLGG